jgi:branched-chain amino acid transport system permease protein
VFAIFAAVLLWRPQGLFGNARTTWTGVRGGFRLRKEWLWLAALAALVAVPYLADAYWILQAINILTFVALATAWAFFSGPTRYVSLAASAFYGLGAYCVATLASSYSYPVALLAAVAFSAVLSALVGLATLRLSGMYFVIFTFGLAELVKAAVTWWEFNVAHSSGWYVYLSITDAQIYYQLLVVCAATVAIWLWRDRTRMGFAMRTLGADETVARQIGIHTVGLKIGTFVVASVVMALAGAIIAPRNSYVTAHSAFDPQVSFITVIAALLGGATSAWGPMLGVVPLLLLRDFLSIKYSSYFSVLLGAILLVVVFFIPNGLIGLLKSGRAAIQTRRLADLLDALARRLRGEGGRVPPASSQHPHSSANGAAMHHAAPRAPDLPERKVSA